MPAITHWERLSQAWPAPTGRQFIGKLVVKISYLDGNKLGHGCAH